MRITTYQLPSDHKSKASLFIDSVQEYQFHSDGPTALVPQGRFEMIFQLEGEFIHRSGRDKHWFERPQAFLGGLHSCSYDVRAKTGEGRCLGVTIKPNMAHLLVRDKLNHFENSVIDLESVFGNKGKRLSESVMNEDSLDLRMQKIDEFFSSFEDSSIITDSSLLIEKSLSASDDCRIAELSTSVGLSESHFRRLFRELVGINAKRFFKIRRVNRAIDLIQKDTSSQLTRIAYALGFFDQAHFIREFRSVTGRTPKFFLNPRP